MGEVYRAHDARLGRDVAVKVLPPAYTQDPERLRRFEQEARAAGMLNHPGLLAVYDLGVHEGAPYVVSELLDGETLRQRLTEGPLPPRKAIDFAAQVASGLAAAHEKGIVHRDLKPENLFLTRDGRAKILDFGLAKLAESDLTGDNAPTLGPDTTPGTLLGTVGYMAPEQVRGQSADARSDLFAVGAVLYEMLSGQRAFRGESTVETLSAILREDPPDLSFTGRALPPALERIVRHCLEKNPEERFQSARDLAFDLQALSDVSSPATPLHVPSRSSRRLLTWAAAALAVVATVALGFIAGRRSAAPTIPVFHQLTFQRGRIDAARLAPDGHTIVYSARWSGSPSLVFTTRPESPESRSFDLQGAWLLAASRQGELAVLLGAHPVRGWTTAGTLARLPLAGGAPREILEDVQWADWSPNGDDLAIVRDAEGRNRLEYPIGTVLYESDGWISHPRVSSSGDRVAFIDHPTHGDDGGNIAIVDRKGHKTLLSSGWLSASGLAWAVDGKSVWLTATRTGVGRALYAVTLSGNERVVDRVMGTMTLHDIATDGRVLMTRDAMRMRISCRPPGAVEERDLSWLDWSLARAISEDGRFILFDETGEGGGARYATYLRSTDGAPPVRLGEGAGMDLSPDGRWALNLVKDSPPGVVLLPTRAGEPRRVDVGSLHVSAGCFSPDGTSLFLTASAPGEGTRIYVVDLAGGSPRPVTPEGLGVPIVSPDGHWLAAVSENRLFLFPVDGGEPRLLLDDASGLQVNSWSTDGKQLLLLDRRVGQARLPILRFDIATRKTEPWMELAPEGGTGSGSISAVRFSADERSYAYSYVSVDSDLFLAEELH
jgi:eukaryotic-like serine/threonine-protein kinase